MPKCARLLPPGRRALHQRRVGDRAQGPLGRRLRSGPAPPGPRPRRNKHALRALGLPTPGVITSSRSPRPPARERLRSCVSTAGADCHITITGRLAWSVTPLSTPAALVSEQVTRLAGGGGRDPVGVSVEAMTKHGGAATSVEAHPSAQPRPIPPPSRRSTEAEWSQISGPRVCGNGGQVVHLRGRRPALPAP